MSRSTEARHRANRLHIGTEGSATGLSSSPRNMQATIALSGCAAGLQRRQAAKQLPQAAAKPVAARRQAVIVRAEGEGAAAPGIETKGPNMTALKVGRLQIGRAPGRRGHDGAAARPSASPPPPLNPVALDARRRSMPR